MDVRDILEARDVLLAHCGEIVVVDSYRPLVEVDRDSLGRIRMGFRNYSWVLPYSDKGLATLLFCYVLYVRFLGEGKDILVTDEEGGAAVRKSIREAAIGLVPRIPDIVPLFEEVYGIRFSDLRAGTYLRRVGTKL